MKAIKVIVLAALLVGFSACNKQQDPLKDVPYEVIHGVPPSNGNQPTGKPLSKESLQIDAPSLVNGRIGSPLEIKIQGRVLIPNVGFTLQVENLNQFPGATFDKTTGVFKWTPVREILSAGIDTQLDLVISLVTTPGATNYPVSMERKTITVNVFRNYLKPVITSVTGTSSFTAPNRYNLNVELEDQDAVNANEFTLVFEDCGIVGRGNVATAISYDSSNFSKSTQTGKFKGFITLDLAAGLPYSLTSYCFTVATYSRYGVLSDSYPMNLLIKNPLSAARVTTNAIEIKKGTIADYSFSFYDPKQVGNLRITKLADPALNLPGSTIACTVATSVVNCKLSLNATTALPGKFDLNFTVQNSLYPQDSVDANQAITVNVLN